MKYDQGKPDPTLLEVDLRDVLDQLQEVLQFGARKYKRGSWKSVERERYDAAARRHRICRDHGEVYDKESHLHHLAHEITNLMFMLHFDLNGEHGDEGRDQD